MHGIWCGTDGAAGQVGIRGARIVSGRRLAAIPRSCLLEVSQYACFDSRYSLRLRIRIWYVYDDAPNLSLPHLPTQCLVGYNNLLELDSSLTQFPLLSELLGQCYHQTKRGKRGPLFAVDSMEDARGCLIQISSSSQVYLPGFRQIFRKFAYKYAENYCSDLP